MVILLTTVEAKYHTAGAAYDKNARWLNFNRVHEHLINKL